MAPPIFNFKYVSNVTPTGAGNYTVNSTFNYAYQLQDYQDRDNPGDDLTQLGDIAYDHFKATSINGVQKFVYDGETTNGVVATYGYFHSSNEYFLFSNTNYQVGDSVVASPDPYTVCYCSGTLISAGKGDVAVERLAIGDVVVTASGAQRPIKWIGHRSYSARFAGNNPDLLPVCFKAGSLADAVPARDLWVSPKHAMFLDGVLVPAEHLVNGVTIVKAEHATTVVEYWHVELDSHDVLLAEGAPSESFVDDHGRGIFHNAHTFREMYPDARRVEAVYCAPRVEHGYALDRIRRRLAARAGLARSPLRDFGELRGWLDLCDGSLIQGWAQSGAFPDAPVCLDVVVDGVVVARAYAELFRADLKRAGIGDGHHAFSLTLPEALPRDEPHHVELRRSADGAVLAGGKVLAAIAAAEAVAA